MRETFAEEIPSGGLRFLYRHRVGGLLLRLLSARWLSRAASAFLDSPLSKPLIRGFIRRNGIRTEEYLAEKYRSFNAFFTRRIRPELRPFAPAPALASPCDGRLTLFPVSAEGKITVKGFSYTADSMLGADASAFYGGYCFVIRLTVCDYHRYHYPDDGRAETPRLLGGKLHTVQPVALGARRVLCENVRSVTVMHTRHFGEIAQAEIGAMFVGRIVNEEKTSFARGEEKGRFEFGGSTIVLFTRKGTVIPDGEFAENTSRGLETRVLCGERIGVAAEES